MELLILVFILGILLLFLAPAINRAIDQTDYVQCESNLEAIRRAKSAYVVDHLGVSSDAELPEDRHLFTDPWEIQDDKGWGVFRAHLPARFEPVCPRTGIPYQNFYHLFLKTTCTCQSDPP